MLGIVLPEVMALRIGIGNMDRAHTQNLLAHVPVSKHSASQLRPIRALSPRDHVVDGGKRELLMREMAVLHAN